MPFLTSTSILNIAHRGARAYAPENTLAAFAKAKSFGCQMFELDARLSKDEVVVVYHDEHLKRCTDAENRFSGRDSYQVSDFTYKELATLDAGNWYIKELSLPIDQRQPFLQSLSDIELSQYVTETELKDYSSGNIKIPTLTETLCLAKELGIMINVELKSNHANDSVLVKSVLQAIQAMNMEAHILISSFNHDLLKPVRHQNKKIATAILIDQPLSNPISHLRKLKANAYNLGCYHDYRTDKFDSKSGNRYLSHIKKLRTAGFDVNIWTCNDQEEMGHLIAAGVSGLITDYPNRVKAKLSEFLNHKNLSLS